MNTTSAQPVTQTPEQAVAVLEALTQHPDLRLNLKEHLTVQSALQVVKSALKEPS